MSQIVTINGRPHDLDWEPSLKVGNPPLWRTPMILNSEFVHGVTINGYDYPPAGSNSVLYLPGLPGQGATIWDRSPEGNHGTITGAIWKRLPSGLRYLDFDGLDDIIRISRDSSIEPAKLTLKIWMHMKSGASEIHGTLFDKPFTAQSDPYYSYLLKIQDVKTGSPAIYMRAVVGSWGGDELVITSIQAYFDTWAMVVATFDEDYIRMDINGGERTAALQNTGSLTYHATDLRIGGMRNYATGNFYGGLALLVIESEVWSTAKIASHYNQERHLFGV